MPEEPSEHNTPLSEDEDDLRCFICSLKFETETERNMHVLAHPQDGLTEAEILMRRKLFYREVKKQQEEDEPYYGDNVKLSPPKSVHKPRRIYKPPSKRVGLTKIRMEDCLRCDACSCIYIDPEDYYKHMRNFHEKYNTVIPRTRRRSPVNRVIIPVNNEPRVPPVAAPALPVPVVQERPRVQPKPLDTRFIAESIIRQSIKSRWSKVLSERLTLPKRPRLSELLMNKLTAAAAAAAPQIAPNAAAVAPPLDPNVKIKQEPVDEEPPLFTNIQIKQEPADDDMSYLLSQVEVKIKTEPPDDYGAYAQVDPA